MKASPLNILLLTLGILLIVIGLAGGHWFAEVTGIVAILVAMLRRRMLGTRRAARDR